MGSNLNRWTALEDNYLLNEGKTMPIKRLRHLVPGRSIGAIKARMHKLGIKKGNSYIIEPFTPQEDLILFQWFKTIGAQAISERYLTKRDVTSIYSRAQTLGLTLRGLRLPKEDIELIVQLYIEGDLSGHEIASKFDLDPAYVHQVGRRTMYEWLDEGRITYQDYLRALVIRTANPKHRTYYVNQLINFVRAEATLIQEP